MYIYCDTTNRLLHIRAQEEFGQLEVCDMKGLPVEVPLLSRKKNGEDFDLLADAGELHPWHPNTPVLYHLSYGSEKTIFGFCNIRSWGNKQILFNDVPIYLRGYIRGIAAHEHPNMSGGTLKDAAVKNIRQAKKYGFNLVRFHSTIPSPEFVEAADEEGILIHVEIGFSYDFDSRGKKKNLSMSNKKWTETLLRYRNHPSIAIFCIGNEMHRSGHFPEVRALYEEGKTLAPGKLIMDNSGWGEFDRTTSDIFSQHIAYYFPYKHHADMFRKEDPWLLNGSATDAPMDTSLKNGLEGNVHRSAVPVRPVIAHEACHYIEIPDYEVLNRKFDQFCTNFGEKYLQENGIEKPRYMTELPKLIRRKGIQKKIPDYMAASQQFKMFALKTYLEKCRLSGLCGFEMLQFADCLKYENKNGIVDCFDDDKYIPAEWMRQFNGDIALLADLNDATFFYHDEIKGSVYLSDYLASPEINDGVFVFKVIRDDGMSRILYRGENFIVPGGLQKLISFSFRVDEEEIAHQYTLSAEFHYGSRSLKNEWKIWLYPHKIAEPTFPDAVVVNRLSDSVFVDLERGKTVFLFYDGGQNILVYFAAIGIVAVLIGIVESVMARFRFLKVPQFINVATALAVLAIIFMIVFGEVA